MHSLEHTHTRPEIDRLAGLWMLTHGQERVFFSRTCLINARNYQQKGPNWSR